LESFGQGGLHALLVVRAELFAVGRKVKHIDRHLAFRVDERNLDVALLVGEA
jgi:hypothetical protein